MKKKKVILAIDDNQADLAVIHAILQADYDVRVAKSAADAFDLLDNFKIDLILLDIEMPDISGFEFLRQIKKMPQFMYTPVVIVSCHCAEEFVTHSKTTGADGFLGKPLEAETLRKMIKDTLKNPAKHILAGI